MAQTVKNLLAMQETWVWSLSQEDPLEKGWQPTPIFLPEDSHGQRSLVGYRPRGRKELDTTERLALSLGKEEQCWTIHICVSQILKNRKFWRSAVCRGDTFPKYKCFTLKVILIWNYRSLPRGMEQFIKESILIKSYLICSAPRVWLQLLSYSPPLKSTNSFHSRKINLLTVFRHILTVFHLISFTLFLSSVWKAGCFTHKSYPSQNKSSRSCYRPDLPQEAYLVFGIINISFNWLATLTHTALQSTLELYEWGWCTHQGRR